MAFFYTAPYFPLGTVYDDLIDLVQQGGVYGGLVTPYYLYKSIYYLERPVTPIDFGPYTSTDRVRVANGKISCQTATSTSFAITKTLLGWTPGVEFNYTGQEFLCLQIRLSAPSGFTTFSTGQAFRFRVILGSYQFSLSLALVGGVVNVQYQAAGSASPVVNNGVFKSQGDPFSADFELVLSGTSVLCYVDGVLFYSDNQPGLNASVYSTQDILFDVTALTRMLGDFDIEVMNIVISADNFLDNPSLPEPEPPIPPDPTRQIDNITEILSYCDKLKPRLIEQFKLKENLTNLLCNILSQADYLESTLFDINLLRLLDSATGENLNLYGQILDVPRYGIPDEEYRIKLKGKIGSIISSGEANKILFTAKFLSGASNASITEVFPGSLIITINSISIPDNFLSLLNNIRPVGVYLEVYYTEDFSDTFTFLPDNGIDDGLGLGFAEYTTGGGKLTEKIS